MNETTKKSLKNRLKRVQGQVGGLGKMVSKSKYCPDIIIQALAVEKSLASFRQEILKNHLNTCFVTQVKKGKKNKANKELLYIYKLLNK